MTGGLCCGGCGSVSMFGVKRDFHIWEIVYFLLAIDVLVHALVVEAVHQKQQVALPRQSDWWMKILVVGFVNGILVVQHALLQLVISRLVILVVGSWSFNVCCFNR
ncbi:hypothetical protein JHK87_018773 [Glycine soja]|nr:hypothetical protein JHK87_018773 [Glycine soja]